jgi:hypothetical protein
MLILAISINGNSENEFPTGGNNIDKLKFVIRYAIISPSNTRHSLGFSG